MSDHSALVERLEAIDLDPIGRGLGYRNPDGQEAASVIRTLTDTLSRYAHIIESHRTRLAEVRAELEADKGLREAATNYVNHYLIDEYDDPRLCFGRSHHDAVVRLYDAVKGVPTLPGEG